MISIQKILVVSAVVLLGAQVAYGEEYSPSLAEHVSSVDVIKQIAPSKKDLTFKAAAVLKHVFPYDVNTESLPYLRVDLRNLAPGVVNINWKETECRLYVATSEEWWGLVSEGKPQVTENGDAVIHLPVELSKGFAWKLEVTGIDGQFDSAVIKGLEDTPVQARWQLNYGRIEVHARFVDAKGHSLCPHFYAAGKQVAYWIPAAVRGQHISAGALSERLTERILAQPLNKELVGGHLLHSMISYPLTLGFLDELQRRLLLLTVVQYEEGTSLLANDLGSYFKPRKEWFSWTKTIKRPNDARVAATIGKDMTLLYSRDGAHVVGVEGTLLLEASRAATQSGTAARGSLHFSARVESVDLASETFWLRTKVRFENGTTEQASTRLPFRMDHAASVGALLYFIPDDPMTTCGCCEAAPMGESLH